MVCPLFLSFRIAETISNKLKLMAIAMCFACKEKSLAICFTMLADFHEFLYCLCLLEILLQELQGKTLDQRFGANLRNPSFAKFLSKFLTFLHFFSFLAHTTLKIKISTSVLGSQHPNSGQNIHQTSEYLYLSDNKVINTFVELGGGVDDALV